MNMKILKNLEFYWFWKWEYLRRKEGIYNVVLHEEESGSGEIIRVSAPGYVMTSTEILKFILAVETLPAKSSEEVETEEEEVLPAMGLEEAEAIFGASGAVKLMSWSRPKKVQVEIDFENPLRQVLAEIGALQGWVEDQPPEGETYIDLNDRGRAFRYEAAWERLPTKIKRVVEKRNHTPRAVGLWLYDYIKDKYGDDFPRGGIAEAIRALRETFDLKSYTASDSETHRNQYKKTIKCITTAEVLQV